MWVIILGSTVDYKGAVAKLGIYIHMQVPTYLQCLSNLTSPSLFIAQWLKEIEKVVDGA